MTTKAADQKHCFSCGSIIHASSPACPNCGAAQPELNYSVKVFSGESSSSKDIEQRVPLPLPSSHVYCRGCGHPIHETAYSCPKCGATQRPHEFLIHSNSGGRNRVAAALFAFLLGGVGGHKFYLGSIGMGILYLVFCWTFVPAIVSFIEGILFLMMSDQEFDRKYH